MPPFLGAGSLQTRLRVFLPQSHVWLQAVHDDHGPQCPSTGSVKQDNIDKACLHASFQPGLKSQPVIRGGSILALHDEFQLRGQYLQRCLKGVERLACFARCQRLALPASRITEIHKNINKRWQRPLTFVLPLKSIAQNIKGFDCQPLMITEPWDYLGHPTFKNWRNTFHGMNLPDLAVKFVQIRYCIYKTK